MGALLLGAIVVAELPPVQRAAAAIGRHRTVLLTATVSFGAAGFLVFMGGIIALVVARGTPMSHDEVEEAARRFSDGVNRPYVFRASAYRIQGAAAGREAHVETSFAAMIGAWRSGEWWRDPEWRRIFVITTGASAFASGMLASFIVAGPPHVKVLVAAAFLYAVVMTVRGVRRAGPSSVP
jgi:hypothetical protein